MKMINAALLLALIVFPFFWITRQDADFQKNTAWTEQRYNAALDTAVQDAGTALMLHAKQEDEALYRTAKRFAVNKEAALDAFVRTLNVNFGIVDDPIGQKVLLGYIPAVVVIGYDGYDVYAVEPIINGKGENELRHVWWGTKPYAYADQDGNSYSFTLDDRVGVYEKASRTWHEGRREEVAGETAVPLLKDASLFEQVRRSTIIRSITRDLELTINLHNVFARKYGITYTFTLPTISEEEWNNTIDDIGIQAFIQGIPMGRTYYNNYALGGGRVVKKHSVYGFRRNGIKYYARADCSFSEIPEETFASEKEAAAQGYYPAPCQK